MAASVLLVDDEPEYAASLAERLTLRGYDVAWAESGERALEMVEGRGPDVLLLDVHLPGLDGPATLAALREAGVASQAVLLTGQAGLESAVAGFKLGAVDYLSKAAPFEELLAALESAYAKGVEAAEASRLLEVERLAALGRVAEGAAHEINNPVTIMASAAGWIDDLLDEAPESFAAQAAEIRDSTRSIRVQAERVKALLARLRRCGGRFDPRPETVLLAALADQVAADLAERATAQGAAIHNLLKPETRLDAPKAALEHALTALVDNALDALSGRGGNVVIEDRSSRDVVSFAVVDEGPGVPEALKARVFEPFFSTRDAVDRSGLGLPSARGIAQSLGGDLTVADAPLGGAAFVFSVPRPNA